MPSFLPDWADPQLLGRNRTLTHSPWGAYADTESARRRGESPYRLSLNGTWKFALTDSPATMPERFLDTDADLDDWHDIAVPGNWQLDPDVDDAPIYTNMPYPFRKAPPEPPQANPTGWYRTTVDLPAAWDGRRVFIHFESCDSACKLWVNGHEAGYSQDSKLPHEFDITDWLQPGANTLAVMVPRYCDGFWLECQDYWHLSGIQRDVTLFCKPESYLRDLVIRTSFDAAYKDAELFVAAYMNPSADFHKGGYSVRVQLYDAGGEPVLAGPVEGAISLKSPMYGGKDAPEYSGAHLRLDIRRPQRWTAETPYLYTLVAELLDRDGAVVDIESSRVGFRQVEIKERQLLLNGRRMIVRGVDAHEHHPERGRAMTSADMRDELIAMKRLNFNAVRTSHYPRHSAFYDLCDELGVYVVDEANLETHGIEALTSRDPAWMNACMERAQRLALRDKNHPSVIVWSLGNESFYGPHHAGMAAWLRRYDPTRPVQYESGFPEADITDIMAPMYPKLDWVEETMADHAEKRPMIMCEYAYSKGNALGNVHKYWELVDRWPAFQGGFVWDWRDKALVRQVDGQRQWAYGNEFDDGIGPDGFDYGRFENPQMCLNGVVHPDLTPKPGAYELMAVQAPVAFLQEDADALARGEIGVWNKYLALTLSHLEFSWELTENGQLLHSGVIDPPEALPGAKGLLQIPIELPAEPAPGGEYWLNLRARYRDATPWCEAGHAVAWHQFALPVASPALGWTPPRKADIAIETTADGAVLRTSACAVTFTDGRLSGWRIGDRELLAGPLEHCFMRARTDNDYMIGHPGSYYEGWVKAGLDRLQGRLLDFAAAPLGGGQVLVRGVLRYQAPDATHGFTCTSLYTICGQGRVEVQNTIIADAALPCVARVGMVTALDPACEQLAWYGRGPHENYSDRKHSALIDRHSSTVREQFIPFVDPCECGGHEDTRWLELSDGRGFGLRVDGQPAFHWSALHYTVADLLQAGHVYELTETETVNLHIDGFHMGLGGDTGWTRNVHEEYLLPAGTWRYGFVLQPLP